MRLKDFKYTDQNVKKDFARSEKYNQKIKFVMDYCLDKLPVNELDKDDSFNFDNLDFDEGKNYHWFFLKKKNLTILVRQYRTHFTFFSKRTSDEKYERTVISVFTISNDDDKMDDEQNDNHCDDNFMTLSPILPDLVKILEENKAHTLWNDHCLKRPKYVDVKICLDGESVPNLDLLIFAMDELSSTYVCTYAQNDVLDYIKTLKVGEIFGSAYRIDEIRTDRDDDDNYHGVGISITNTNFEDSESKWQDVYSLAAFYYRELEYDQYQLEKEIKDFTYKNHNLVMKNYQVLKDYGWMSLTLDYKQDMYNLYIEQVGEIEWRVFRNSLGKEFDNYIEISHQILKKELG